MKKLIFMSILFCSISLVAMKAQAVTLSLEPSYQFIYPYDTASLDLSISGLTKEGPDSLGAFSLDITYDDSILAFESADFGLFLGDPDFLEAVTYFDSSTPGRVYLDEVSFLFDWELDALQSDSFILATLTFRGIKRDAASRIGLENIVLSDSFGTQIPEPTILSAGIKVIPEPTSLLLLGFGLAGLAGLRRFKVKNS